MKFIDMSIDEKILQGIKDAGFEEPTTVQADAYKVLMEGRDLLAQSQTGTGKTAAFLIGLFQLMLTDEQFKGRKALVVVPTRELADQVEKEAKIIGKHTGLSFASFFGGVGYKSQLDSIEANVDLIIGTPGRLIDLAESGKMPMKDISLVVIDEADRLFDMGFLPDLRKIFKKIVPATERRTMLFSATLNSRVGNLAWELLDNPEEVYVESETLTVDAINQSLYHVSKNEKMNLLLGIFKKENPKSALIFANTKGAAYEIAKRMEDNGYKIRYLIGDLPQKKRLKIMEDMKKGQFSYLVATDVAARGLHIDSLDLVVNYDLPEDPENYVHRIGRTGRAGENGLAISLACERYVYSLPAIEKYIDQKIEVSWADEELYLEDKSEGKSYRLDSARGDRNRNGKGGSHGGNRSSRENRRPRDNRDQRDYSKTLSHVAAAVGGNGSEDDNQSKNYSGKKRNKRQDNRSDNRNKNRSQRSNKKSRSGNKGIRPQSNVKVSRDSSVEDRLALYKEKYGEDFQVDGKKASAKKNSPKKGSATNKQGSSKKGNNKNKNYKGKKKKNYSEKSKQDKNNTQQSQNKKSKPNNQKAKQQDQKNINKSADKPAKKKGFFSKLFGK